MPHQTEMVNCSVAIRNTGKITICRRYDGKDWQFPKGGKEVTIVPFSLAHHFFGFEIEPRTNRLYRNTDEKYDEGDETAYYVARANFVPWGWINDERPFNPRDPKDKQIPKSEMYEVILDTWENHITGKLLTLPREMSVEQFEALPVQ
jgi:hypothetical protein